MNVHSTTPKEAGAELTLDLPILDAFPAGVLLCDQTGNILLGNGELHRLFGYAEGELNGQSLERLLPPKMRREHHFHLEHFFANPAKRTMGMGRALFGQRQDGSTFPIEIGLNPIDSDDGPRVIATVADISERRRLENNFERIVDAAPIGMLIVDSSGIIQHGNRQIATIFGYSLDEIRGQPLEMLLPERSRDQHLQHRTTYAAHPTVRAMGSNLDLTGLHKNGHEIPVEIGLTPIDADNDTFIVATVTDTTERRKAELKLKQVNAELDEFTYVASHDLKSPLRGIASLIEWIEEDLAGNMSEEVRHNFDRIHLRLERMEKLVEDLLSYARSGHTQKEAKLIVLQKCLDNVIQLIAPPETFKFTMSGYLGEINTPATPLETVLRNLISNAIKHHDKDRGEIRINIAAEGSFCIFEIGDDGPGIPPAAHGRIFKLFQTLANSDKGRSGVGLAVCKRMVESHGGRIEVYSQERVRGTTFRFWWPRFSRSDINE